ncbi:MAG: hypothetical protein ACYDCJ_06875 [Gammaproteobacteria bacterium]
MKKYNYWRRVLLPFWLIPALIGLLCARSAFAQSVAMSVGSAIQQNGCFHYTASRVAVKVCASQNLILPSGYDTYFYVGSTAGGQQLYGENWRPDLKVIANYSGNLSVSIGRSHFDYGIYHSAVGNYAIAGIGLSGYRVVAQYVAKANSTSINVTFLAPPDSRELVIVGGQGVGNLRLSTSTLRPLVNETYSEGGSNVIASAAIYLGALPAGTSHISVSGNTFLENAGVSLGAVVYVLVPDQDTTKSPAMTVSPQKVIGLFPGNTLVFTYTAGPAGIVNGAIGIQVPSGWTRPTAATGVPGTTNTSAGDLTVGGSSIAVRNVSLPAGGTLTITYSDVSASTPGQYVFIASVASNASEPLAELRNSPIVIVQPPSITLIPLATKLSQIWNACNGSGTQNVPLMVGAFSPNLYNVNCSPSSKISGDLITTFDGTTLETSSTLQSVTNNNPGVAGYPEIIYGYSPWKGLTTTEYPLLQFPIEISNLPPIVSLAQTSVCINNPSTCTPGLKQDVAYDLWITHAKNPYCTPATPNCSPIGASDLELMIWLYHSTTQPPAGSFWKSITAPVWINGQLHNDNKWDAYICYSGDCQKWTLVSLILSDTSPQKEVVIYPDDLVSKVINSISTLSSLNSGWLNGIEFGTEFNPPTYGGNARFDWEVSKYSYQICPSSNESGSNTLIPVCHFVGKAVSPAISAVYNTQPQQEIYALLISQQGTLHGVLKRQMQSAVPLIVRFVSQTACISKGTSNEQILADANQFTLVGHSIGYVGAGLFPAMAMSMHLSSNCLEVTQIGGWRMPTLNTLNFTVRYTAQDSGQIVDAQYGLMRYEGQWYLVSST